MTVDSFEREQRSPLPLFPLKGNYGVHGVQKQSGHDPPFHPRCTDLQTNTKFFFPFWPHLAPPSPGPLLVLIRQR
jgi:hypothetical protein